MVPDKGANYVSQIAFQRLGCDGASYINGFGARGSGARSGL